MELLSVSFSYINLTPEMFWGGFHPMWLDAASPSALTLYAQLPNEATPASTSEAACMYVFRPDGEGAAAEQIVVPASLSPSAIVPILTDIVCDPPVGVPTGSDLEVRFATNGQDFFPTGHTVSPANVIPSVTLNFNLLTFHCVDV
eukprot:scaffold288747_cov39-Prasinocladus_malaysianus.AAC.1